MLQEGNGHKTLRSQYGTDGREGTEVRQHKRPDHALSCWDKVTINLLTEKYCWVE